MKDLMPIDGAYFTSMYFAITSIVAICVSLVGAYVSEVGNE